MQTTYRDEDAGAGAVEIREYQVLATTSMLGFNVQVAEWEGCPFILLRAQSWKGRQPRFAITQYDDAFADAVHNLLRHRVHHERTEVSLASEEPIRIAWGIAPIPAHHTAMQGAWNELTGRQPS